MAKTNSTRRAPLDRETIVHAAIELADAQGSASLTMRGLAEHLGFKAMALYNHVASKDELIALMLDAVAAEVPEPPGEVDALVALRNHAVATRDAFLRHPWASALWHAVLPGPARTAHMECVLRLFANSGLTEELAHHGFHAVNNHVLGYTLQEQAMAHGPAQDMDASIQAFLAATPAEQFPHTVAHVHEHLNGLTTPSFELVLDLILDGLSRLSEAEVSAGHAASAAG